MHVGLDEPCPYPDDPMLADAARSLADGGHWGSVFDAAWQLVYMTDDLRRSFAGSGRLAPIELGRMAYSSESLDVILDFEFGYDPREAFLAIGGMMLNDFESDPDLLRSHLDPSLHDLVDGLQPDGAAVATFIGHGEGIGRAATDVASTFTRIRDDTGALRGLIQINKPMVGMHTIATLAVQHDRGHLERTQLVMAADRRPAAILFADLESSSKLARRLSTASYFSLNRRLVSAADGAILRAGGLVGRHVGDGVVAFFPSMTFDTESQAARACIQTAHEIRDAMVGVADRSGLESDEVIMRFGLHWGATVYIGGISTGARTEVTALGDEVNEAARIEACARGGRILASKQLLERLDPADSAAVGLGADGMVYTQLADLPGATDKARRDAPSVAVCEL